MVFPAACANAVVGATARTPAAVVAEASVSRAALREKARILVLLRVDRMRRVFTLNAPGHPSGFSWLFCGLIPSKRACIRRAPERDACRTARGTRRKSEMKNAF